MEGAEGWEANLSDTTAGTCHEDDFTGLGEFWSLGIYRLIDVTVDLASEGIVYGEAVGRRKVQSYHFSSWGGPAGGVEWTRGSAFTNKEKMSKGGQAMMLTVLSGFTAGR